MIDIEEKRRLKGALAYDRMLNRRNSKRLSTKATAISLLKDSARKDTWCTTHENCFRYSPEPVESKRHRNAKLERHAYWRARGASVWTELIFKSGKRCDLVVCMPDGDIFIEEILESEPIKNIKEKEKYYPFKIRARRIEEDGTTIHEETK